MTDPTPTITCFVQTQLPGMNYGDIVTLAHTPYVDALIAGGRLVAETDPIYARLVAGQQAQPPAWNLLDTAVAAASPAEPVTPATAALNAAPAEAPAEASAVTPVEAPAEAAEPAPVEAGTTDSAPAA